MASNVVESAAAERRERLRALRAAAELVGDDSSATTTTPQEDEPRQTDQEVKFRNYIPRDKKLQPNKVSPPSVPKFDDPVAPAPVVNGTEDPLVNIAPKKPNWDLRRDVAKKLEKLERRTQRALVELMQEEERRRQESLGDVELTED